MVPQRENLIAALLAGAAALAGSLLWAHIAAAQAICPNSLIGGPLLSDQQAAQGIGNTQSVSTDAANAAANSYFANNGASASYASQLALYHNTAPSWGGVTARIDGACPLGPHPDTAAVINWAANKWGISPQLMFAEASVESHWRQSAVGDSGGSVGLFQVANNPADRPGGQYHAFPGLLHSPLPSESSCFNADFYAGRLYAVYHGLAGATTPAGNLTDAVQAWYQHDAMVPGDYSNRVCSLVSGGSIVQASNSSGGDLVQPSTTSGLTAALFGALTFLGGAGGAVAQVPGGGAIPVITVPGSVTSDPPVEASLTTPSSGNTYQANTRAIAALDAGLFAGVNSQNFTGSTGVFPGWVKLPRDSTDYASQLTATMLATYAGALNVVQQQAAELEGENFAPMAAQAAGETAVLAESQDMTAAIWQLNNELQLLRQQINALITVEIVDHADQLNEKARMAATAADSPMAITPANSQVP